MVVKKKKEEKTKKKVVKKQVVKKDVKKNKQEIDKLKKQLKALSVKYLNERKKRTTPKQYQKVKTDIESKVSKASSQSDLIRLISLLGGKGSQPTTTITTPATQGTIKSRTEAPAKASAKASAKKDEADIVAQGYKDYKGLRERMGNLRDKYNNGTLEVDEVAGLYKDVKKFGKGIYEELPTWEQTLAVYEGSRRGAKKIMDYLKRFMNQHRPANEMPVDLSPDTTAQQRSQTTPPPPPPPATTPTPPPPPAEGIRGNPVPVAEAPEIPLIIQGSLAPIQYLNSITGTLGTAGLLAGLGVGGMLGNRLINNRQGENDRLIRNRQEVGVQAGRGLGQAGMAEGARAVAEGVANVARDLQLDREALDSTQDTAERLEQNERDITEARGRDTPQQAREFLERGEERRRFRMRDAERRARGAVAEEDLQRRRENLRGSGVSVEDIEGMEERMLREAEEAGIRGAGNLVRNFGRTLEGQFDVGMRVGRALEEGGREEGLAELRRDDMPEFDTEGNTIV